ncbi:MerR family transcriptional regulator [Lactiplantibacillus sp. WILCCON 0030]|uniref:MerR family transcriptional regulator n=1 Tax=Lactiplantibacillus brownii TaxID=3069269 RepID=A0ABU1AAG2_9LACO|nr:MerR family transcriptional regulator [Lactiplantibacillus brownii]MDQ7937949.1 MerR family transcriptional regulator [Lactiplantibacillus brownii]
MLTIQKFAKLAGTTRRTLIFYDEKDLFKPKKVAENGYRYYDYDQLYPVTFILELRHLGLPISEIKLLTQTTGHAPLNAELKKILSQINQQLDNLTILRETLNDRFNQSVPPEPVIKNRPFIQSESVNHFCRSRQSVACTEAEIAEIYADFYAQLGRLKLVDQQDSGFLTQLPHSDANGYPTASFCILKAVGPRTDTGDLPLIEKPAGKYVSIDTTNDIKNICIALRQLADYLKKNKLPINGQLWQMNLDENFTSKGASPLVRLQYQLQN